MNAPPAATPVLFLAYWYPPENESGAHRPARLAKYLQRLGYAPGVVAAACAAEPTPRDPIVRTPSQPDDSALTRLALRLIPYNDRIEWVSGATAAASAALDRHAARVVISTSPPVATHLVALNLRRRHRFAWVADFRDPIVGNPFRQRWHGRIYDNFLEGRIVKHADAILVNTDAALESFARRFPRHRQKFHLLWNGFDPEEPLSARPVPARSHRMLAHFGSIYGPRQPGMLVGAMARLMATGKLAPEALRLRLVGTVDHAAPWLKAPELATLRDRGLIDLQETPVPRAEAQREMAESDYLLLIDLTGDSAGVQVPAKLFEYVRIGRPILALTTRNSPVERILARSGIPHVCMYVGDDAATLDTRLLELLSMPPTVSEPSRWFHEEFDARAQGDRLAALLATLARGT